MSGKMTPSLRTSPTLLQMASKTQLLEKFEIDLLIRQQFHYLSTQQYDALFEQNCGHPQIFSENSKVSTPYWKGTARSWITELRKISAHSTKQNQPIYKVQPMEIRIHENRALVTSSLETNIRFIYKDCVFELDSHAHLIQRLIKEEDDQWRILSSDMICIRDSVKLPSPQVRGEEIMERARTDIATSTSRSSFKVLAWWLGLQGRGVREDAAGHDDGHSWRTMMVIGRRWLITGSEATPTSECALADASTEDEQDDDILGVRQDRYHTALRNGFS